MSPKICLPCQGFVVVTMMRTIMMIILNMNIAGSPLLLALLWTLLVYCQSASNRRDKVRLPAGHPNIHHHHNHPPSIPGMFFYDLSTKTWDSEDSEGFAGKIWNLDLVQQCCGASYSHRGTIQTKLLIRAPLFC